MSCLPFYHTRATRVGFQVQLQVRGFGFIRTFLLNSKFVHTLPLSNSKSYIVCLPFYHTRATRVGFQAHLKEFLLYRTTSFNILHTRNNFQLQYHFTPLTMASMSIYKSEDFFGYNLSLKIRNLYAPKHVPTPSLKYGVHNNIMSPFSHTQATRVGFHVHLQV